LKELGLESNCRFTRTGHQISWDGHDVPFENPKQLQRDLETYFPGERRGLRNYFRWVEKGAGGIRGMLGSDMMFGRSVPNTLIRIGLRQPLFPWAMAFARGQTNRSIHRRYFGDPLLCQMFDQLGYPVMSGQNTLGMWVQYFDDCWIPLGGMQTFANAFVRFIRKHGGEIHLEKRVRRILVEDGAAIGIELEGREFAPAQTVIATGDFHHTCFELIGRENLSPGLLEKLEQAAPSESVFSVYLGLDADKQFTPLQSRFQMSHVWFTSDDGEFLQLVLLSKDDPSIARPGKHALALFMLSPYEEWEPLKNDPETYRKRKADLTNTLIDRAGAFLPGLRQHIEVIESASPLTYERYTSNWRGSTAGWNWNPQHNPQLVIPRDLPVNHFYAAGHYVHSPGGVPSAMITAWYVAQEIIRKNQRKIKNYS
jgi:prolycopene isomerase